MKTASKKILIVEDELAQRKVLAEVFQKNGFTVVEAGDGLTGFEIAAKEKPNIILLDILMPRLDGISMLKKIRGLNEWGKKVPVVILTNLSDGAAITNDAHNEEVAQYLVKADWKLEEVVEKVKDALKINK